MSAQMLQNISIQANSSIHNRNCRRTYFKPFLVTIKGRSKNVVMNVTPMPSHQAKKTVVKPVSNTLYWLTNSLKYQQKLTLEKKWLLRACNLKNLFH